MLRYQIAACARCIFISFALSFCSGFANAETNTIAIKNYAFVPASITVAAGTNVTWLNEDDDPHTIKSDPSNEVLKSPALDTNDKFSFTFTKPGVYKYFCTLHPHMQGEIVVR